MFQYYGMEYCFVVVESYFVFKHYGVVYCTIVVEWYVCVLVLWGGVLHCSRGVVCWYFRITGWSTAL